ncbi:MAG: transposase [Candidatus Contendobacter sp.]
MVKVFRYRVKSLSGLLSRQSRAVNFVWNFCNDTQKFALKWHKRWPSGFDLNTLTTGTSKDLGLHAGTINAVCEQYAQSRAQKKRPYLRYRGKKALGWVPFKGRDLKREGNAFRFHGQTFRVFYSRPLPEGKIKDGSSFARDARGHWFLNSVMEVADVAARAPVRGVGIDLGLKDFATLSTGDKIENKRHYRTLQARLGIAQRARKRRQVTAIHAKIVNQRTDFLHKEALKLVQAFDYIAVGNVNAAALAKTRLAKSVLDAGWSFFRNRLRYKAIEHGAWFEEVDERMSTQVCSTCGCTSGPKGVADLGIRVWVCGECGSRHDRDQNSAVNILLRSGHRTPVVGIPTL